jgi:hypothetical protein
LNDLKFLHRPKKAEWANEALFIFQSWLFWSGDEPSRDYATVKLQIIDKKRHRGIELPN